MPSAFSHAAVGMSLACFAPRRLAPHLTIGLALLAAAPDLDVVGLRLGIPYDHALGHRGLSHSLFFALGVAAMLGVAWRFCAPSRWWAGVPVLAFLALASHGLLDTLTDAGLGIGLLLPFDETRYFAPWRPLLTSPLSVEAFFSGAGVSILRSEIAWLGPPIVAVAAVGWVVRRRWGSS